MSAVLAQRPSTLDLIRELIRQLPQTTENLEAVISMADNFANAPGWIVDLDLVQSALTEAVAMMEIAAPNEERDRDADAWARELELRA